MSNISIDINAWGDEGTDLPSGFYFGQNDDYIYVDDINNAFFETFDGLTSVINTVNSRLESRASTSFRTGQEEGEFTYRTDTDDLYVYDGTTNKDIALGADLRSHENSTDNPHSVSLEQARSVDNTVSGTIAVTGGRVEINGEPAATQQWVLDNQPTSVAYADNAGKLGNVSPGEYYRTNGNDDFVFETRTSDPASPAVGRAWIRTDL